MRGEIDRDLDYLGLASKDIRYREAGNYRNIKRSLLLKPELLIREFKSSDGLEFFLSYETDEKNPILYSFLRLRLSENSGKTDTGKIIFPELENCALIREVHTYGKVIPCKDNMHLYENNKLLLSQNNHVQHKGYGKKLLEKAEEIAINHNFNKIAVIAGVGVREYYRKQGYIHDTKEGCFQMKYLESIETKINKFRNTNISFSYMFLLTMIILFVFYSICKLLSLIFL